MKKWLVVILVLMLLLTIVGCSETEVQKEVADTETSNNTEDTADEVSANDTEPAVDGNGFVIQPKSGDKYKVGVVVKTLESAFYQNMANGLLAEYADSDTFEVIIQASKTETDTAGFIQIIEDMITKDIDVLIVVPGDPDAVLPTLENVVEAGIPVICSETDAPGLDGKLTYIGIDNVQSGGSVVNYLFEQGILESGFECAVITGPVGYIYYPGLRGH